MKIVITGHTSGLGKYIYDHFSNEHECIGLSRSSGYDINNIEKVAAIANTADIFFNNACSGIQQSRLIDSCYRHTKIITSGSIGADFANIDDNEYFRNKKIIEMNHNVKYKYGKHPMLLLKMGFLENWSPSSKTSISPISYQLIVNSIMFWIDNTRVSMIEIANI